VGSRRSADPESKKGEKAARKIGRRPEQGGRGPIPRAKKGAAARSSVRTYWGSADLQRGPRWAFFSLFLGCPALKKNQKKRRKS
jgi:hypothetical protein